jgi:WD40 repeat protein
LKTFKVFATFEGHSGFVYSVKFTKDARFAASGGSDKIVLLWNVLEKRIQFRFDGHSQIVWKVLFTDDDKNLVSANCFEGVFVWSVENGRLVFCFKDGVEAKDWVLKNKGIQGELSRFLF